MFYKEKELSDIDKFNTYAITIKQTKKNGKEFLYEKKYYTDVNTSISYIFGSIFNDIFIIESNYRKAGLKLWNRNKHLYIIFKKNNKCLIDTEKDFYLKDKIIFENAKKKRKCLGLIANELKKPSEFIRSKYRTDDLNDILKNQSETHRTKTQCFGNHEVNSIFKDSEAILLCGSLNDTKANSIYSKYFLKNEQLSEDELFYAHKIAMNGYEKEGKSFIDYILSLPKLPFQFERVDVLVRKLNKIENPVQVVSFKGERFKLYSKNNNVVFQNEKKAENTVEILANGKVKTENIQKIPISQFNLFFLTIKNLDKQLAFAGYKTGECSICGRELTDKKSILNGYGKTCAEKHNLKWF